MEISEAQLNGFIELYKKEFDIILTPAQAQSKALSLLRFMAISVVPIDFTKQSGTIDMPDVSIE